MDRTHRVFAIAAVVGAAVAGAAVAQQPVPAAPVPAAPAAAAATVAIAPAFRERAARRQAFPDGKVRQAIRAGLLWLCQHQDPDGRWDCDGFMQHDVGEQSAGAGNRTHDIGVTALAVLALLAEADPARIDAVERGVDWLVGKQRKDGWVAPDTHDGIYSHVIATQALVEACAVVGRERWRDPATAALNRLVQWRNPGAAWRYGERDGDNDTSLASWGVAALAAGFRAGFAVPPAIGGEVLDWFDSVTDDDGWTGYTRAGEPSARHPGDQFDRFPPQKGEAMTAAALHARLQLGQDPSHPLFAAGVERLLQKLPATDDPGAIDFYYWFHASQAMAQLPPAQSARWFKALDAALLGSQCSAGSAAGSWDPVGAWGQDGGRVYTTAVAVLSLQARYRLGDLSAAGELPRSGPLAVVRARLQRGDKARALSVLDRAVDAELDGDDRRGLVAARWFLAVEQRAVEHAILRLQLAEHPDWFELFELLDRTRVGWRGTPLADRAERELHELQGDASARPQLEAGRRLQVLHKKYGGRKVSDPRNLIEQLQKLMTDFPDTPASTRAQRWMQQLQNG